MSLSNRSTSANAPLLPQSRSTQSSILHPPSPPSMQQHTHHRPTDDWQTNTVQRPSFYGGVGSNTKPVPVTINVYDLHPYNRYLHWLGMGVYHSGVQVFNSEYTYGLHPYACTGVFETPVKHATGAVYRCTHIVGHCTLTKTEFAVLMEYMKSQFLGCDYHLLLKNCNHFADALCEALGVQCPSYVNRLAKLGWRLRWCLPQWMLQINVPTEDSETYDGADPYNLSSIDSPTIHPRFSDDRNFSSDDYIRYSQVQSPRHRKQSKDYDKLGNTTLSSRRLSAAFTLEGHASPSHKLQQEGRSSTPHADDAAAVEQRQRSADDYKSHGHSSSTSQLSQRSNGTSSDDSPMLTLDTTISDRDIDLLGFADRAIPNDKALLHSPFASPQKPHKKYAKHASDSFA